MTIGIFLKNKKKTTDGNNMLSIKWHLFFFLYTINPICVIMDVASWFYITLCISGEWRV